MNRLAEALKVRPGEERMVALVIGMMLFVSAGGSIGGSGIEALLFARFGVKFLPYLFMALGAITLITSLAVTALLGRMASVRLYTALLLVLILILAGERLLLALDLKWFYPLMWLAMMVMLSLQGQLTWGLAGTGCDTRQAKRLFPLFGAGGILGTVLGGLSTRPLVNWLHSENLLLVWAAALLVAFALSRALVGGISRAGRAVDTKRTRLIQEMQQGYLFVRRSPLMRWLSWSAVVFAVLYFSLAFPFAKAAAAQFRDEDALAGFLGLFQGLSTGAAFLASLFVANRLYARFGVPSTILALAVIYLAGFGTLAVYAAFPILVAFRFVQMAWLQGIAGTAYQALLNVVPPERRDQTRAFIDGVPGQAGIVIAGLILVIGDQALRPQHLFFVGLGAALLTTFLAWQASRAYGGALVEALRAGQPQLFSEQEEPFGGFRRDAAAMAVAVAGVAHSDPVVRRLSAEILGNLPVPEATGALVSALGDADAQVRAGALRALARAAASPALLEVAARLDDPEPEVRMRAVEAVSQLAGYPRAVAARLRPMLADPAPLVRARVAVELLRIGPDSEARDLLRNMAVVGEVEARGEALAALGEWGDAEAFELVAVELEDVHAPPAVRRAAASALVRIDPGRSVGPLIRTLGDDDRLLRETAAGAIGQIGAPALDRTVAALSNPALEAGALLALERLPARRAGQPIRAYCTAAVARALHYYDLWRGTESQSLLGGLNGADDRTRLLTVSLRDKARGHGLNALRAVGLLGERASVALAIENLMSRDASQRANALETLESIGRRWSEIVRPLLRLWEPANSAAAALPENGGLPRLRGLLTDSDAWLRACSVLVAAGLDDPEVHNTLAQMAQHDPDAVVRDAARRAVSARDGGSAMETLPTLSLMERILFLRRVPLFAELAPADLKQVAGIAGERLYPDGEVIARQGQPGDEMYIIVTGVVRVIAGGHGDAPGAEVARRAAGEYVGEMAIISQEPRMASLVAAGDVRTLYIDRKQFEGILRERPETALAVMRVLIARLKENQIVAGPRAMAALQGAGTRREEGDRL